MSKKVPNRFNSIVETIGNTPIVKLRRTFTDFAGLFYAKVESFNPGRSSKDRIGVTIIDDAEKRGLLKEGGTIVESTSGNTGLGLALIGIDRGYNVKLVMPDKMSPEKMNLVKAMGCDVVVCPTDVEPDDPRSYYSVSKKLAEDIDGAFLANQYFNEANPLAHYLTTGPEIWEQTDGKITHFFAGVGTGGTISGVGRYLKEQNPDIKIIGVDPKGSILAHYHATKNKDIEAKSYKVEGVGEDIIPATVNFEVIDDFVTVNDKESFDWTREVALKEGMLVGGSSGLAVAGAHKYAENHPDEEYYAVILLPDTGERYLGKVFSESWLRANEFMPAPQTIEDILGARSANLPDLIAIEPDRPISYAIEKMKKFDVDQVLVTGENPKVLTKNEIFRSILDKTSSKQPVAGLNLQPIKSIPIDTDLREVLEELKYQDELLILQNGEPRGYISKQDIFNNLPVSKIEELVGESK